MEIPPDVFLAGSLEVGVVYYYFSDQLKSTSEPHYCVILCIKEEWVILVCATSKIEKRKEFIRTRKLPLETLVFASPKDESFLNSETAFNCNDPFIESIQSLSNKHSTASIKIKGKASNKLVESLTRGLLISPMVEEKVKDLFR